MRSMLKVERYESGVPMESLGDRIARGVQPLLAILFAVLIISIVRPMALVGDSSGGGESAGGWLRLLLVLGCTGLLLTVTLPDTVIPQSYRPWIAGIVAILSGALMGLGGQGWAAMFAYMLAVHSGVRYPARMAIRIMALCVLVAIAVSQTPASTADTPWWADLLVFAALVPGMTRRTRQMTLAAAHDAVVQGRRAAASEAQARAMAERASIARDIHDVLAHSLSGVNMQLSLADALLDSGDEEAGRAAVHTAQRLVIDGLQEARSAMQALRGDTIDPAEAIAGMVTGPEESCAVTGVPHRLPSRVVHTLVRVAQESLTNARRHAPGAPVTIALDYRPTEIELSVTNGAGTRDVDRPDSAGSGLGLVGIRERVKQVGGRAEMGPHGPGWAVRVWIPFDPTSDESMTDDSGGDVS